jgi:hypothetical protein
MRVKLQRASATDLPAYNPILPPSAITQVMLIAYPPQVRSDNIPSHTCCTVYLEYSFNYLTKLNVQIQFDLNEF